MLKSGIIVVDKLGRFNVGKLRAGKFNGGNEVDTDVPVGSVSPLVCNVGKLLKVLFVLSDGRLNDGKDNVGSVGTDSGGRPVVVLSPVLMG